jgi:hypothetical protein
MYEAQAARFQRLLQQLAGHLVQLALHQRGHHVDNADLHAALHQAVGRLQAQQAAADDHGALVFFAGLDHGVGVGDVTVGDHASRSLPGIGRMKGLEPVPAAGGRIRRSGLARGVFGMYDAAHPVHLGDLPAGVQRDAVVLVPGPVVEHDFVQRLFAGEHRRQQDAVVVGVGFGAEDGDVVQVGRDLQQLFERAHASHAVADHDQLHSLLGVGPHVHGQAAFSTCAWRV